jgi:hypothetical protein
MVNYISRVVGRAEGNEQIKIAPKQVNWIVRAWTYLKQREDLIKKLFLVTGISCATDGSEDHPCHDDIPLQVACKEVEKFIKLAQDANEIELDFSQIMRRQGKRNTIIVFAFRTIYSYKYT